MPRKKFNLKRKAANKSPVRRALKKQRRSESDKSRSPAIEADGEESGSSSKSGDSFDASSLSSHQSQSVHSSSSQFISPSPSATHTHSKEHKKRQGKSYDPHIGGGGAGSARGVGGDGGVGQHQAHNSIGRISGSSSIYSIGTGSSSKESSVASPGTLTSGQSLSSLPSSSHQVHYRGDKSLGPKQASVNSSGGTQFLADASSDGEVCPTDPPVPLRNLQTKVNHDQPLFKVKIHHYFDSNIDCDPCDHMNDACKILADSNLQYDDTMQPVNRCKDARKFQSNMSPTSAEWHLIRSIHHPTHRIIGPDLLKACGIGHHEFIYKVKS